MFNPMAFFSSSRSDWRTPRFLYRQLDRVFRFDFDPCPSNPTFDGLAVDWGSSNFVNPPYGRELCRWLAKARRETEKGKTSVFLLPGRTDTRWWHDHVMRASEIWFIRGRLRFDDQKQSAPFPSVVAVFRKTQSEDAVPAVRSLNLTPEFSW